jgi:hypothetical protein
MHKIEVGRSRPTENKATNSFDNCSVQVWKQKIFACGDNHNSIASVLVEMITLARDNKIDTAVIRQLVTELNLVCSLEIAMLRLRINVPL